MVQNKETSFQNIVSKAKASLLTSMAKKVPVDQYLHARAELSLTETERAQLTRSEDLLQSTLEQQVRRRLGPTSTEQAQFETKLAQRKQQAEKESIRVSFDIVAALSQFVLARISPEEYAALRESVLRRWIKHSQRIRHHHDPAQPDLADKAFFEEIATKDDLELTQVLTQA